MLNQNNDLFVEERRVLLERFMKEIAKYDYIVFSKEFKVFARGKGEIDKVLFALPKQTPMQVLEKYRLNFKLREDMPVMLKVTLRGAKAYDFIERLTQLVLPRVRDFN